MAMCIMRSLACHVSNIIGSCIFPAIYSGFYFHIEINLTFTPNSKLQEILVHVLVWDNILRFMTMLARLIFSNCYRRVPQGFHICFFIGNSRMWNYSLKEKKLQFEKQNGFQKKWSRYSFLRKISKISRICVVGFIFKWPVLMYIRHNIFYNLSNNSYIDYDATFLSRW